jgi:hypothetical protein
MDFPWISHGFPMDFPSISPGESLVIPNFPQENRRLREHLADSDQRCVTAVQLLQQAIDFHEIPGRSHEFFPTLVIFLVSF